MKNTAFYGNWATFWDGPRVGGKINGPLTMQSFISGVDRVIYGYLMFGVKPNPALRNDNLWPLDVGCMYHGVLTDKHYGEPYYLSGDFDTYGMYPNYCFTGTVGNWFISHDYRIEDDPTWDQFAQLKQMKPGLEITASYGGWTWTHGGAKFSDVSAPLFHNMVTVPENRAAFIASSYAFLTSKGFDGVDFDWEYPGQANGGIAAGDAAMDFYGLEQLIKEYRAYAKSKGNPGFIITMQCSGFLSGDIHFASLPGYDGEGIKLSMQNDDDYFTWLGRLVPDDGSGLTEINIMAYDYFTATTFLPGQSTVLTVPNAPVSCGSSSSKSAVVEADYELVGDSGSTVSDAPADPNCGKTYTFKQGDIPATIAHQFGVEFQDLCNYNNLEPNDCINISVGRVLLIPPKNKTPCPSTKSTKVQITAGVDGLDATSLAKFSRLGVGVGGEIDLSTLTAMNKGASGWPNLTKGSKYYMCGEVYTVVKDDTAATIAHKYGVSIVDLCNFNGFSPTACNTINVGTKLGVPVMGWTTGCGTSPPPPPPPPPPPTPGDKNCGKTYAVKQGDSIDSIAKTYNVTDGALCLYNSFPSNCSNIQPEEILLIPPTKSTVQCPSVQSTEITIQGVDGKTSDDVANFFKIGNLASSTASPADASIVEGMNKGATWPMKSGTTYKACGTIYTIKSGDSISNIALTLGHGVDYNDLCAYNGLTGDKCTNIQPGNTLVIPAAGWTTSCSSGPAPPPPPPPKPKTLPDCLTQTLDNIKKILPDKMDKFVLGLACYGRSFGGVTDLAKISATDRIQNSVFLPSSGPAPAGNYTGQAGVLSFFEIEEFSNHASPFSRQGYDQFEFTYNDIHANLSKVLTTVSANNYAGLTGQYQSLKPYFVNAIKLLGVLDDPDTTANGFAAFDYNSNALFLGDTYPNIQAVLDKGKDLVGAVQNIYLSLEQALAGYNNLCSSTKCSAPSTCSTTMKCAFSDVMSTWQKLITGVPTTVSTIPDIISQFTEFTYSLTSSLAYEKEDPDAPGGCADVYAPKYDQDTYNKIKTSVDSTLNLILAGGKEIQADPAKSCIKEVQLFGGTLPNIIGPVQTQFDNWFSTIGKLGYTDAFEQTLNMSAALVKMQNTIRTVVDIFYACCPPSSSAESQLHAEAEVENASSSDFRAVGTASEPYGNKEYTSHQYRMPKIDHPVTERGSAKAPAADTCPLSDSFTLLTELLTPNPTEPISCPNSYTVKKGDSGPGLLKNLATSFQQLIECNPGLDLNNVQLGQVLKLPATKEDSTITFAVSSGNDFLKQVMAVPGQYSKTEVSFSCSSGLTRGYNTEFGTSVGYNVQSAEWVSYDDVDSIGKKIDLAKQYNLGGVMSFMPQQDNWAAGYPLMQAINKGVAASSEVEVGFSGGEEDLNGSKTSNGAETPNGSETLNGDSASSRSSCDCSCDCKEKKEETKDEEDC